MTRMKKGFTLIELLVVIAIIGILSAVVLASLNNAREKGNIAAVKANLKTIQVQSELYYDNNSTYGTAKASNTTCSADLFGNSTVSQAKNAAESAGQGSATCAIGVNGQSYAIAVRQKTSGGSVSAATYWCVDYTGKATSTGATSAPNLGDGSTVVACP